MGWCLRCCCGCWACLAALVALLAVLIEHWRDVKEPPASMAVAPARDVGKLALPGGGSMPFLGLGLCCRLTAGGDPVRKSVLWYLLLGGRHLDGAEIYRNHKEVGQGIRQAIARGVPREEIFFTTKIPGHLFGTKPATDWVHKMLNDTGLDYADLVLLHAAGPERHSKQDLECGSMPNMRRCREETWLALDKLRSEGKIRHLGVSNFGERQITELQQLQRAPVAVNQVEFHPWVGAEYRKAVDFCHRSGVAVTAHSLFGGGHRFKELSKDPTLSAIAAAKGKSISQLLLRWAFQQNVSAIPGTGNPEHMKNNMDIFDFELSDDQMASIDQLSKKVVEVTVHPQHVPDAIA